MANEEIVARLQAFGPLPAADSPPMASYPLLDFDDLVQQITLPFTADHALALLNLGPPPATSAYEVEWALVHAVELASVADLRRVLPLAADTEVTRLVALRLANYAARLQ